MDNDVRAYVAYVSGKLISKKDVSSIFDRNREEHLTMAEKEDLRPAQKTAVERSCGTPRDPEGANYCLIPRQGGAHICLSLYGKLFEGFDHGSSSHFNGFVDDDRIAFYDFSEADYFTYTF